MSPRRRHDAVNFKIHLTKLLTWGSFSADSCCHGNLVKLTGLPVLCLRSPWKGLEVMLLCFLVPWLASSTCRSLVAPRTVGPARGGPPRWRRRLGRLRLTSPGRGPPTRCTLSPLPGALAGGWHKHDCPSGTSSRPCMWAHGVKQGEMVNPQAPCQLEAQQMFPSPLTLTLLCPSRVGQTEPALQWSRPHPGLCIQAGSCSPLALP